MLSPTISGQMASLQPDRSVVKLSASRTLNLTDNGRTFCAADNAADYTITVPATLPEGFEFTVYCNSTLKKIIVQFSGSEQVRNGSGWSTAGGTAYFDGAGGANTGYSAVFKKLNNAGFAFTYWGVVAGIGAATLT